MSPRITSIPEYTDEQIFAAIDKYMSTQRITHEHFRKLIGMKQGAYSRRRKKKTGWRFKEIQAMRRVGVLE